jgi:hypothetical protein
MTFGVDREPPTLLFYCNICGKPSLTDLRYLDREVPTCQICNSNARVRAVIQVLSTELFGENPLLPGFRNDLVFHGGPGATLEMRVFSETALIQHLKDAGFANIKFHRTADLVHGVWWPELWAFPMSARKRKACRPDRSRL